MRSRWLFPWLALSLLFAACSGKQGSNTRIVVMVWSDLIASTEVDKVRIEVTGPSGTRNQDFPLAGIKWPVTLDLVPADNRADAFSVKATAWLGERPIVSQEASLAFLSGESRVLKLYLSRTCIGVPCPASLTCSAGLCSQAVGISLADLPPYVPGQVYSPPSSASVSVDGGGDAQLPIDVGLRNDVPSVDLARVGPFDGNIADTVAPRDSATLLDGEASTGGIGGTGGQGAGGAGGAAGWTDGAVDAPSPDAPFVEEDARDATGSGGTVGSGGVLGSGGAVGSGGTIGSGGMVATGGIASTGGLVATGGAVATGGLVTTGGAVATGGAVGSGGVVGTGGASSECPGIDLNSPLSCGTTCANRVVCSTTHGTATCTSGVCGINCESGFGNCDNDVSTGCEISLNLTSGCGTTCANRVACSTTNGTASCTSGVCGISCTTGYGNCDNDVSTGCEISLNLTSGCGTTCGNRVACSTKNGTASCASGVCSIACSTGFGDCDTDASTGCEVDLNSPETCGTTCANRVSCRYGVCQSGGCPSTQWGIPAATGPTTNKVQPDNLWAVPININRSGVSSFSLRALGISVVVDAPNPSVHMRLGLYSSPTGAPNTLIVQTDSFSTVNGVNEILLPTAVDVAPASYWAVFVADGNVRVQAESNTTAWPVASWPFGSMPASFPAATSVTLGMGHLYAVTAP